MQYEAQATQLPNPPALLTTAGDSSVAMFTSMAVVCFSGTGTEVIGTRSGLAAMMRGMAVAALGAMLRVPASKSSWEARRLTLQVSLAPGSSRLALQLLLYPASSSVARATDVRPTLPMLLASTVHAALAPAHDNTSTVSNNAETGYNVDSLTVCQTGQRVAILSRQRTAAADKNVHPTADMRAVDRCLGRACRTHPALVGCYLYPSPPATCPPGAAGAVQVAPITVTCSWGAATAGMLKLPVTAGFRLLADAVAFTTKPPASRSSSASGTELVQVRVLPTARAAGMAALQVASALKRVGRARTRSLSRVFPVLLTAKVTATGVPAARTESRVSSCL